MSFADLRLKPPVKTRIKRQLRSFHIQLLPYIMHHWQKIYAKTIAQVRGHAGAAFPTVKAIANILPYLVVSVINTTLQEVR